MLCCSKTFSDPFARDKLNILIPEGDPCRRFRFDWPKFLAGKAKLQMSLRGVDGVNFRAKTFVFAFDLQSMWIHCGDVTEEVRAPGNGAALDLMESCMLRLTF